MSLGFGADPYLAGEASFETIAGLQNAGVQAWYAVPRGTEDYVDLYLQCKALHQQVRLVLSSLERSPLRFE